MAHESERHAGREVDEAGHIGVPADADMHAESYPRTRGEVESACIAPMYEPVAARFMLLASPKRGYCALAFSIVYKRPEFSA